MTSAEKTGPPASSPPSRAGRPLAERVERMVLWAALGLLAVGSFLVVKIFLMAILWGAVIAWSTWPLHARLVKLLRGRRTLSALIVFAGIALLLLAPIVLVVGTLAANVDALATATRELLAHGLPPAPEWVAGFPWIGTAAAAAWNEIAADTGSLFQYLQRFVEPAAKGLLRLGILLGSGVLHLLLSLLVGFFLLRDGAAAAQWLQGAVKRIAGERGESLLALAGATTRGIVYGILGTAIIQGGLAALGLVVAGVPAGALLGVLAFFCSFVPLGPSIVLFPAAFWLFHEGQTGWGVFMIAWAVLVSTIDNVIKPWLISQGSKMPFLLILMGILGGAAAFGIIGVFLGPTLLAVAYRLIREWAAGAASAAPAEAGAGKA